ncbi:MULTISPECIES: hypothetical protein [Brachymonas]|uniref:hypothetical protein n=1 Tax=Brachymonas TaxID=28219 RepID=UPI002E776A35|nr:hypothetical protein [Brachymonas sp. J145]MEE1653881.1 hypothetical protein [Brachymonas sp. J145]
MQRRSLPLILAVALASPLAVLAAEGGHNHGDHGATPAIQLNNGQKWASDAPLRQGMNAIHTSTQKMLQRAHSKQASAADYAAFDKQVNTQINYIIKNCKLEPKADAQLHGLIAQMMQGSEMTKGKQGNAKRADGVLSVAKALNTYGDYFSHPGWKKINVGH